MIYTATAISSQMSECFFRIKNYGQLPPYKQMRVQAILEKHFSLIPQADDDMLVFHVIFGIPTHVGMYTRRLEILMWQLRAAIDPLLTFSTELVYAAS